MHPCDHYLACVSTIYRATQCDTRLDSLRCVWIQYKTLLLSMSLFYFFACFESVFGLADMASSLLLIWKEIKRRQEVNDCLRVLQCLCLLVCHYFTRLFCLSTSSGCTVKQSMCPSEVPFPGVEPSSFLKTSCDLPRAPSSQHLVRVLASSDPLGINFGGCKPYCSQRMQPATLYPSVFVNPALTAEDWDWTEIKCCSWQSLNCTLLININNGGKKINL